jgi:hypothetical protein
MTDAPAGLLLGIVARRALAQAPIAPRIGCGALAGIDLSSRPFLGSDRFGPRS